MVKALKWIIHLTRKKNLLFNFYLGVIFICTTKSLCSKVTHSQWKQLMRLVTMVVKMACEIQKSCPESKNVLVLKKNQMLIIKFLLDTYWKMSPTFLHSHHASDTYHNVVSVFSIPSLYTHATKFLNHSISTSFCSSSWKWLPAKNSFSFGKLLWKSLGAKSELYGGCLKTSQPNVEALLGLL